MLRPQEGGGAFRRVQNQVEKREFSGNEPGSSMISACGAGGLSKTGRILCPKVIVLLCIFTYFVGCFYLFRHAFSGLSQSVSDNVKSLFLLPLCCTDAIFTS